MHDQDDERLARALGFIARTVSLVGDKVQPIDAGLIVRTPELPAVWAANQLLIDRAPSFEELLALADQHLEDLPYRQIHITDQSA